MKNMTTYSKKPIHERIIGIIVWCTHPCFMPLDMSFLLLPFSFETWQINELVGLVPFV
jgi:hypothetical protein